MKLFNTLTGKKQVFKPLRSGKVSFYACGPTVYGSPHIGHARTYVFEDILRRTLEYNGYEVHHIINVTDVGHLFGDGDEGEDKIEKSARTAGQKVSEITKKYFGEFKHDLQRLNVLMPAKFAWASKYIPEQKMLLERIFSKKYAYITDDGIYFDTQKFGKYGRLGGLANRQADEQQSRIGGGDSKRHPFDFALWKFSEGPRLQEWSSPLKVKRKGYPGWHLECSAISVAELGQPFDIHAGGIDHVTTHHNNEIAQSESAYGKPLAKYWLHGEHLLMQDSKMSKSVGNVTALDDLIDTGFDPLALRYLILTTHYRSRLHFQASALQGATVALGKLREVFATKATGGKVVAKYQKAFAAAIGEDLNTAQGLAVVWELVKSSSSLADKQATLVDMDRVLGLGLASYKAPKVSPAVLELARERQAAREAKDWAKADELRGKVEQLGYTIKDTAEGFEIIKL